MKLKYNNNQVRFLQVDNQAVQEDTGLLKVSFSSTEPYPRYFGVDCYEVIGHDDGDMDLSKLNNKAAVLFNHDFDELIGNVQQAWVENGRGYALIKLSSTADKYKTMIEEGILSKLSFGYIITEMIKIGEAEDGKPIVKVKTQPYEVSLVSVPADDTTSIIRSHEKSVEITIEIDSEEEQEKETTDPIEDTAESIGVEYTDNTEIVEEEQKEERKFDNGNQITENININFEKGKNIMKEILALGRSVGEMDLAVEFVESGKSLEQFKSALIEKKMSSASNVDAGTQKEVKKFSLSGLIQEQSEGKDGYNSAFAREMSQDFAGVKSRGGIVLPKSVFARDYTVAGNAGTTASQDYRANVIAQLYNTSVVLPLVNRLPDATGYGSIKYPKLNGKNSFGFITENQRANESNVNFDHIVFTPKTIGGRIVLSRDIMKQSSLMIDNIAKAELLRAKDEFLDNELLNGDGVAGWTGVFNISGAQAVEFGANGGNVNFAKVVEFGTKIDSANAHTSGLTFITNSKVVGALKTSQKFANYGSAILENGQADGYNVAVSNQVRSNYTKGTGSNLSGMALINGSMLNYIEWGYYELVFNPYRLAAGQVEVELFLTADFQPSHTEGVVVAKDIIA